MGASAGDFVAGMRSLFMRFLFHIVLLVSAIQVASAIDTAPDPPAVNPGQVLSSGISVEHKCAPQDFVAFVFELWSPPLPRPIQGCCEGVAVSHPERSGGSLAQIALASDLPPPQR